VNANARTDADSVTGLGAPGRALLDRLRDVTPAIGRRATDYDRTATFPAEDFHDLAAAGLNAPTVPRRYGGLGVGPVCGDALTLWLMTRELAKADLSVARCWEGHANSLLLIDAFGSPEQKARWFDGVVRHGHTWAAWSGEPPAPGPGARRRLGTQTTPVDGGWVLEGTKAFATSATGAQWAILLVNTAGPGGARHTRGSPDTLIMLACDLSDPSVTVEESWWDPIGMRATASHLVRFDRTFLPQRNLIGEPGAYPRTGWQAAFVPHYAASFTGAAEAAYDHAVDYVLAQGKQADPYVRQRVGAMAVNVETCLLWLRHVANLWDTGQQQKARATGDRARHLIEHLALATVDHCVRVCGARSLIRPSPVERILRDLTFYARHDNDDHILATIGRAVLEPEAELTLHQP
jgi:alkylation response protein AidB-like acyl-CoA dehydrogenase